MKKLLILRGIISLASFSGCKKEALPEKLLGTWEVRSSIGGYRLAQPQPSYAPGNGNILKFTETAYQQFRNGELVKTGTYSIIKENSWLGDNSDRLIFDNDLNAPKQFVKIKGNSLTVYWGTSIAADGVETRYARQ